MASNLYEVLEVTRDATVEQIRKAYKKKALQTHPDRLPPGSTQDDKRAAEENFRQINHAYEILTDPEKRKEYDVHGVWPPPEPEEDGAFFSGFPRRHGHRSHTFPDPFSNRHRHHPFPSFAFRDPFELFESIFKDFEDDDFFGPPLMHPFTPLGPFGGIHGHRTHSLFPAGSFGPNFIPTLFTPFESTLGTSRGLHGNYVSENYVSTTINGVTESVRTRRDQDGNEHVSRTYNDGREVYTINGIEQPPRGSQVQGITDHERHQPNGRYLPQADQPRPGRSYAPPQQRRPSRSGPQHHSNISPYIPSQHSQSQSRSGRNHGGYSAFPAQQSAQYNMSSQQEYNAASPPYPGSSTGYRDTHDRPHGQAAAPDYQRYHGRHTTDKHVPAAYEGPEPGLPEDRHHKRWLPRGFGRH